MLSFDRSCRIDLTHNLLATLKTPTSIEARNYTVGVLGIHNHTSHVATSQHSIAKGHMECLLLVFCLRYYINPTETTHRSYYHCFSVPLHDMTTESIDSGIQQGAYAAHGAEVPLRFG